MTEVTQNAGPLVALGLHGSLFLAHLINFVVVLFVAWKWIYTPLLKTLDARSEKIARGLLDADSAKTGLAQAEAQQNQLLREARDQAQTILDEAKGEAKKEYELLMSKTRQDVERELGDARVRLAQEKTATVAAVRAEIGGLIMEALEKTVPQALDESAKKQLLTQAIQNVERQA